MSPRRMGVLPPVVRRAGRDTKHEPSLVAAGGEQTRATAPAQGRLPRGQVSALIPVYRPDITRLQHCIAAVAPQVQEIVVGYDGAADACDIYLPKGCRSIRSGERLGYAKIVNRLARAARGHSLLLLNDDVFLDEGAVAAMRRSLRPRVGLVGCLLRYPDGTIQHSGMRWREERREFEGMGQGPRDVSPTRARAVDAVTFAAVLVRRDAFEALGGLDEAYDCYWEDMDFCFRARAAGWRVLCQPRATGVHEESRTTRLLPNRHAMWAAGQAIFLSRFTGSGDADSGAADVGCGGEAYRVA